MVLGENRKALNMEFLAGIGLMLLIMVISACIYAIVGSIFKTENHCEQILERLEAIEKRLGIEKES